MTEDELKLPGMAEAIAWLRSNAWPPRPVDLAELIVSTRKAQAKADCEIMQQCASSLGYACDVSSVVALVKKKAGIREDEA